MSRADSFYGFTRYALSETHKAEQKIGTCAILNVSRGDTEITFDSANPADVEKARAVVESMLSRGYRIFVRGVGKGNSPRLYPVKKFNPERNTYVVGNLAPEDKLEGEDENKTTPDPKPKKTCRSRGQETREIPASKARATAVAPTAGG